MSPNMLLVTITSSPSGRRTICMQRASTYMWRVLICGILRRHLGERPLPEVVAVAHDVRLVAHHHLAAAVGHRVVEGGADDPLDPLAGVDLLLDGDLVRRALLEVAADVDVGPLGVLAEDHEVDVLLRPVLERAEPRVVELDRAEVDVEVEPEAGAEQDVGGVLHVRHPGVAEGADQDGRVVVAEIVERPRRDGLAGRQVAVGAPVEMDQLQREAPRPRRRLRGP